MVNFHFRFAFLALLGFSFSANAQFPCDNGRFWTEIFPNYSLTSDVVYGSAVNITGIDQALNLDVYQPEGDTAAVRPLLVIAHGGSFMFGSKTGADVVPICIHYAKMGYVVASIEYRLGYENFFPNPTTAVQTVYRATSDMKAAIRYFRKDFENGNAFRIHPDYIFAGGVSAGAFTALHAAYIDQASEIPPEATGPEYGGVEGNSGNPGYSSAVRGVVNLCGAIGDTNWIAAGDPPCVSAHGTADDVVPYGTATISVLGVSLIPVNGSASIVSRLEHLGIDNPFLSWPGVGHTPFVGNDSYMNEVFDIVTPFLAPLVGCMDAPQSMTGAPTNLGLWAYPNPVQDHAFTLDTRGQKGELCIYALSGNRVFQTAVNETGAPQRISTQQWAPGLYHVVLQNAESLRSLRIQIP
jgi:hypothetical protein